MKNVSHGICPDCLARVCKEAGIEVPKDAERRARWSKAGRVCAWCGKDTRKKEDHGNTRED